MTIDDISSWFSGGVILRIPKFFSPLIKLVYITVVECDEDFIAVTTRGWGTEKYRAPCIEFSEAIKKGEAANVCLSSFMPNTSREFLESIKKGRISNPTPWGGVQPDRDFYKESNSALEQSQQLVVPKSNSIYIIYSVQSPGVSLAFLRCRRLISPCKAVTTNCPVVSPSSFNSSIALATSCGTRAAIVCDFALTDFVAISDLLRVRCSTVWQKESGCKCLTCSTPCTTMVLNTLSTSKAQEAHKITKPAGATNTNGPLTTNDSLIIEAAMLNHTTHPQGRNTHTQTQPAFTYVFVAIRRTSPQLKHEQRRVTACTEREARKILVRDFILVLASRIAAQAVNHG